MEECIGGTLGKGRVGRNQGENVEGPDCGVSEGGKFGKCFAAVYALALVGGCGNEGWERDTRLRIGGSRNEEHKSQCGDKAF